VAYCEVDTPWIHAGSGPAATHFLFAKRKEAKKGYRWEAALRGVTGGGVDQAPRPCNGVVLQGYTPPRVKISDKTGNEKNSPAAQTIFISNPFYRLF
jgi:hypothetical protein